MMYVVPSSIYCSVVRANIQNIDDLFIGFKERSCYEF